MSIFASDKINQIQPYVPGEQLKDKRYVKLNTNENPYYVSKMAVDCATAELIGGLNRYSDPESRALCEAIANYYGVGSKNVLPTNGSDEALAFAFMAYGGKGVCYPDVTYGFYDVLAGLFGCDGEKVALKADFSVDVKKFYRKNKTVVIANPNAQTGMALTAAQIEEIVAQNSDNVVVIDQAYVDFCGENVIGLISKYKNLLVINTFSKSRSLAGARVGFAIASEEIISDLKKVKNSFHPYNVNSVSSALAVAAIEDDEYFKSSVKKIVSGRERLTAELEALGFEVLPSSANFVLAKCALISGKQLYEKLRDDGVLVRYFGDKRIADYVRITVGTDEEIDILINKIKAILGKK